MTHSFSAKLLAVKSVCQNKGKRTAGVDGEKWTTPKTKMKAALKLSDKNYKAKPLKRVYIEKPGKKKKRPLSIPTINLTFVYSLIFTLFLIILTIVLATVGGEFDLLLKRGIREFFPHLFLFVQINVLMHFYKQFKEKKEIIGEL